MREAESHLSLGLHWGHVILQWEQPVVFKP